GVPLHAGIEMELAAAHLPGVVLEPRDHLRARAFRAMRLGGHEVVDVEMLAPGKVESYTKAGDADHIAVRFHIGETVALSLLLPDLLEQRFSRETAAELKQHLGALLELRIRLRESNGHRHVLVGDLVVAPADELHEAEAVPEGIGQQGELPSASHGDGLLERRTRGHGALDGFLDVVDDEIEMHRRPMPLVRPHHVRGGRDRRSFLLVEEIYRARGASQLDAPATETPADGEPERVTVEALAGR